MAYESDQRYVERLVRLYWTGHGMKENVSETSPTDHHVR